MIDLFQEIALYKEILIALISIGLSAFFLLIPRIVLYLKNIRKKEFIGEWYVYSHCGDPEIKGLDHNVSIEVSFQNSIILKSFGNTRGYNYKGQGKVLDYKYFVGNWKSINPGSHSVGAFMLIIEPQGRFMAGYYSGADTQGKLMNHPWVFFRNKSDKEKSLNWLNEHTFELIE